MMFTETMDSTDWNTLVKLREELNNNLMAHDADTQEEFVKLLVESLEGKGDRPVGAVSTPLPPRRSVLY
jgi:hypothetical protein